MKRLLLLLLLLLPSLLGALSWWTDLDLGWSAVPLRAYFLVAALVLLVWAVTRFLRLFLWRVGRRLAFTYLLIGLVPVPLATLLLLAAGYIASGILMAHLYRDSIAVLEEELASVARSHLQALGGGGRPERGALPAELVYYHRGRRVAGSTRAPERWQDWWPTLSPRRPAEASQPLFIAWEEDRPTVFCAVERGEFGVLAVFSGDLGEQLAGESGFWVELTSVAPDEGSGVSVQLGERRFLLALRPSAEPERLARHFHPGVEDPGLLERPLLFWLDLSPHLYDLASGERLGADVTASLTGSPRAVYRRLLAYSPEMNTMAFVVFVALAFLIFDIYVVAALMSAVMIYELSRAVDHLSRATESVQEGDFGTRIAVHRRDQIGQLQSSFNAMTESLEELVATAAQKEILEKELEIARQVQQSLLPGEVAPVPGLEFAHHFEPSAAIGGDYYDILPAGEGVLAVVVADVSGHGLSAGLRMAMLKSALQLLVENGGEPQEILGRLHQLQRSGRGGRGFVTASISMVDTRGGTLDVHNAGHPPTYLLRRGEVREIELPGSPLGAFGRNFGRETFALEGDDVVLWLSDGLVEATDPAHEPFGYERILAALHGQPAEPRAVRDHLLAAVERHTGGRAPEDDLTLVVMRYAP